MSAGYMFLVPDTANAKIVGAPRVGYAACTYLPIRNTCPSSCPIKVECYAKTSHVGLLNMAREMAIPATRTPVEVARDLAREMRDATSRGLARHRPLRLFGSGDARTPLAARVTAGAARDWQAKGGEGARVWGYTHAWRAVPSHEWEGVSMLASVESVDAASDALALGYAPAIVVGTFARDAEGRARSTVHKPTSREARDVRLIPCPAQTSEGSIACVTCRLCWDAPRLLATRSAIAFEAHGMRKGALARRLPVLQ